MTTRKRSVPQWVGKRRVVDRRTAKPYYPGRTSPVRARHDHRMRQIARLGQRHPEFGYPAVLLGCALCMTTEVVWLRTNQSIETEGVQTHG